MKHPCAALSLLSIVALVAACATVPVQAPRELVFFPAAPQPARLQFLTSFAGSRDIEAPKSAFETFITGVKDNDRRLDKPYGAAIHDGRLYVCDTNTTVMVFDLKKKTYEPLAGAQGLGRLVQPINISIDQDGNKYVSDTVRQQVVVFDRNDFYVRAYGAPGAWKPVDAVTFEDRLFVADIKNGEIRVFDRTTGDVVKTFGRNGDAGEQLHKPTNLAVDQEGYLYVSDAGRFQIVKMDRDGHVIKTFGRLGTNLGHFARPKGVAVDRNGRVFAVDAAFYNVQIFNQQGFTLLFFGEGGTLPGRLILPAKVVVDYDNAKYFQEYVSPRFDMESIVIVTSQFGDRPVSVFAFGKERGRTYPSDDELLEQVRKLQAKFEQKDDGARGNEPEPAK